MNDPSSWEGGGVEAPYIERHGNWFYMFYAGNACCGAACKYAEGVARARHLLGPWEKDFANPIIRDGNGWRCAGHGTAVESGPGTRPSTWFLYHAHSDAGRVSLAREAVISKVSWADGWPHIADSKPPTATRRQTSFQDNFAAAIEPGWQWPLSRKPSLQSGNGELTLGTQKSAPAAVIGRMITGPSYAADVLLKAAPQETSSIAGLGILGGEGRAIVIGWQHGRVVLMQVDHKRSKILASTTQPASLPIEFQISAEKAIANYLLLAQPSRQLAGASL